MKKLEQLTKAQFDKLKESGLLYTIYPETPNNYVHKPLDNDRPLLIFNPDWKGVIAQAEEIVNNVADGSYNENDAQYIFEEVMTALYGKKFWKWMNKNT